jgi:hypothetical protein
LKTAFGVTFGNRPKELIMIESSRDSSWLPDYKSILASKVYFLRDYFNLRDSTWARGRIILADLGVEAIFTNFCRQNPEPKLYPDFEAWVSQVRHFAIERIAELAKDSRQYLWLSFATTVTGCAASYPQHGEIIEMLDFVAVAAGSAFNAGYYGIHLCKVVRHCPNVFDSEIARFYGGRVYENTNMLARLRAQGYDV